MSGQWLHPSVTVELRGRMWTSHCGGDLTVDEKRKQGHPCALGLNGWASKWEQLCQGLLCILHACVLSHSAVSDSLQPHGSSPPNSSVHSILQARILE